MNDRNEIMEYDETFNEIMGYNEINYNEKQWNEIEAGARMGLTKEQMELYADPAFSYDEMYEICEGLKNGLTVEQVRLYARKEYDSMQMDQIRSGLENGMTEEQIRLYADPVFDHRQMEEIRLGLENGMTEEQIRLYVNPERYSSWQMEEIRLGLEHGLTREQIRIYADPGFGQERMKTYRKGLEEGMTKEQLSGMTEQQIFLYAEPNYETDIMEQFMEGLTHGLTIERIHDINHTLRRYDNLEYDQQDEIRLGLLHGLKEESLWKYMYWDARSLKQIRLGMEQNFTEEQMDLYADPNFHFAQMEEIRLGLESGLSTEQVRVYAKPDFDHRQMYQIRTGLEQGLSKEQVQSYASPEIDAKQMDDIRFQLRSGTPMKQEQEKTEPQKGDAQTEQPEENFPAPDPNAEPTVTILWSEHRRFYDGETMSLSEANALIGSLDRAIVSEDDYYKTKFRIDFVLDGQPDYYIGRQDLGDGDGTLIEHIEDYHVYYENDSEWENYVLRNEGEKALEADRAERDMILHKFVPYLKLHDNLSQMEQTATKALQESGNMTPTETAYHTAMQEYVSKCRAMVNSGEYDLPPAPQLKDFDTELAAYKEHVKEEIAQEAAAAGMTVEEYAANGYEPHAAGLEQGLSKEQVQSYASPEIDAKQMDDIRFQLRSGTTMKQEQEKTETQHHAVKRSMMGKGR